MTTIRPYAAGSYNANRQTTQTLSLKSQLDTLSTQLSTGRTSETYAGLGSGRTTSLTTHATLSALDGYDAGITNAQTQTKLAVASLSQVVALGTTLKSGLTNVATATGSGIAGISSQARDDLDSAIDALNQSAGGSYIFAGTAAGTQPVASTDTILNGDPVSKRDGLKTLVAQQISADLGSAGNGRLTQSRPGATSVSLSEDPSAEARANFGFGLADAPTATGSALQVSYNAGAAATATPTFQAAPTEGQRFRVVVNQPDGSQKTVDFTTRANPSVTDTFPVVATPAQAATALDTLIAPGTLASVQSATPGDTPPGPGLSLSFAGGSPASFTIGLGSPAKQPAVGDSITINLRLHDGATKTVTLTAAASATSTSTTTFAIDPSDPGRTADNIATALGNALGNAASGELTASATVRAAQDLFAGSNAAGLAPRRIAFDATGNATGYRQVPQSDTVIWYQGEDSGTDPRSTSTVRAGRNLTVGIGARANEAPIRSVLSGFAAAAIGMPPGNTTPDTTFQSLATRVTTALGAANNSPSVQDIVTDLSLSSTQMAQATASNSATRSTLQSVVDGLESAPIEEVATKLLDVQNRLQASYQITSSLSKLSLVNYMS